MTVSFQKCTSENKLIEGDCASEDEILTFLNTHSIISNSATDVIDFEYRNDTLPVYQKIAVLN